MAYDKITFQKKLNDSVQVGDDLYYSNITNPNAPTDPTFVSTINWVGEKEIRINPNTAPPSILNTQIADVNIMDNYNGNFDTDISSWTLSALTEDSPTTNGLCSGGGGSYTNDQANCIIYGDCGASITNVDFAYCDSLSGGCSSYPNIHTTDDSPDGCSYHGDCTGVSGSTGSNVNMLAAACTDYGDCNGIDLSGTVIPGTTVASQEESPCLTTGNCFDHTDALAPSYTTLATCTANASCIDGTGANVTVAYDTLSACQTVGTCTGLSTAGISLTYYNIHYYYLGPALGGCIGNPDFQTNTTSWVSNSWNTYSWVSSSWSGYGWTSYTWTPSAGPWVGYNWVNDGSVYHASENISLLNNPQRMYLDSMQGVSTSGYVEQTVAVENGDEYTFIFDADVIVGDLNWEISGALSDSGTYDNQSGPVTYNSGIFTAGTNYLKIRFFGTAAPDQVFAYIDNVAILDDQYVQTGLDNFFMFQKPNDQNVSGLKGYYAEVELTNDSTAKQELFAVGSEITISSK